MSTLSCAQAEFANLRLELTYRHIDQLRPHPRNPRKYPNSQIKKLIDSIKEFGFALPVQVDRELRVVAGHARLTAARKLGMTEVPTVSLDHLIRPASLSDTRPLAGAD